MSLHSHAKGIVLAMFALVALSAAAQVVPDVVTRMEMWRAIASTVGGGVLVGAGLFAWILNRDREQTRAGVDLLVKSNERLGDRIEDALKLVQVHDANPFAHPAASEHNHAPIFTQMDRIESKMDSTAAKLDLTVAKLDALVSDHDRMQQSDGALCAALEGLRRRDPKDSHRPKRKDDSGDDYTALRGKP